MVLQDAYSQNGEDFLLNLFFEGKKEGFYIEVGAFDVMHLCNTYLFVKIGWQGVCVEPHPVFYPKCKENRPESTCVNAVCVGDEGVKEIEFQCEEMGLLSGVQKRDDIETRYKIRK